MNFYHHTGQRIPNSEERPPVSFYNPENMNHQQLDISYHQQQNYQQQNYQQQNYQHQAVYHPSGSPLLPSTSKKFPNNLLSQMNAPSLQSTNINNPGDFHEYFHHPPFATPQTPPIGRVIPREGIACAEQANVNKPYEYQRSEENESANYHLTSLSTASPDEDMRPEEYCSSSTPPESSARPRSYSNVSTARRNPRQNKMKRNNWKNKPKFCQNCKMHFELAQSHCPKCHKITQVKLKCPYCQDRWEYYTKMSTHLKTKHKEICCEGEKPSSPQKIKKQEKMLPDSKQKKAKGSDINQRRNSLVESNQKMDQERDRNPRAKERVTLPTQQSPSEYPRNESLERNKTIEHSKPFFLNQTNHIPAFSVRNLEQSHLTRPPNVKTNTQNSAFVAIGPIIHSPENFTRIEKTESQLEQIRNVQSQGSSPSGNMNHVQNSTCTQYEFIQHPQLNAVPRFPPSIPNSPHLFECRIHAPQTKYPSSINNDNQERQTFARNSIYGSNTYADCEWKDHMMRNSVHSSLGTVGEPKTESPSSNQSTNKHPMFDIPEIVVTSQQIEESQSRYPTQATIDKLFSEGNQISPKSLNGSICTDDGESLLNIPSPLLDSPLESPTQTNKPTDIKSRRPSLILAPLNIQTFDQQTSAFDKLSQVLDDRMDERDESWYLK